MENIIVIPEDIILVNNRLYIYSAEMNILMAFNLETNTLDLLSGIPEQNITQKKMIASMIYNDGFIYFAPIMAGNIWKYNIENSEWNKMVRKDISSWSPKKEIHQIIKYGTKLFFIGSYYPAIIVYDTFTNKIEYIEDIYVELMDASKSKKDIFFRKDCVLLDGKLYLASCVTNKVLIVNTETLTSRLVEVGESVNCYSGIAWDGYKFWLAPRKNSNIVIWDGENKYEEIELPKEYNKSKCYFSGINYYNGKIVFPSFSGKEGLVIDVASRKIEKSKDKIMYKYLSDNCFLSLNVAGRIEIKGDIEYITKIIIEKEAIIDYICRSKSLYEDTIFLEKKQYTLMDFISMIL